MIGKIGEGTFGKVYKAVEDDYDKTVAIKNIKVGLVWAGWLVGNAGGGGVLVVSSTQPRPCLSSFPSFFFNFRW